LIRRYGSALRVVLMLADLTATIALAIVLSALLYDGDAAGIWDRAVPDPTLVLFLYALTWVVLLWSRGLYRLRARWSIRSEAGAVLRTTAILAVATISVLFLVKWPDVSRQFLVYLFVAQAIAAITFRALIRVFLSAARRRGRNMRQVLVIGTDEGAQAFAAQIADHPELGLQIEGFLGEDAALGSRWRYLGGIERLTDVLHDRVIDEVIIGLPIAAWSGIDSVLAVCEEEGKIVRFRIPTPALSLARGHVEELDGTVIVSLSAGPTMGSGLAIKRAIDVVVAAAGLVLLSPLLLGIALAVRVADGGPALFRQERVGLHGRRYLLLKYRSMVPDAEALLGTLKDQNEISGAAFKMTYDPRVTRLGRFLRRSSLDELPQLLNVLRGDMSLVGPRPPLPTEVAEYDAWHRRRLSMKPGITGLWQVEGRWDPEFDGWVRKDLEYIDRWSTWLDIKILLRTIPAVLREEGR
jgi:exopolysaccharide biosynthesis polyprenyl glycosylphosphotransferase